MTTREIAEELFQTLETGLADPCTREEIYLLRDHTCEVITRAVEAERERCVAIIDGETCAGKCDCVTCEMLNTFAAAIREGEGEG